MNSGGTIAFATKGILMVLIFGCFKLSSEMIVMMGLIFYVKSVKHACIGKQLRSEAEIYSHGVILRRM